MSKGLVFEVDWISGLVVGEYEGGYGLILSMGALSKGLVFEVGIGYRDWLLGSMKEVMD